MVTLISTWHTRSRDIFKIQAFKNCYLDMIYTILEINMFEIIIFFMMIHEIIGYCIHNIVISTLIVLVFEWVGM
jgi:hypothetical protein